MTKRNETFVFFLNIALIKKLFFSFFFTFHIRNSNIIYALPIISSTHPSTHGKRRSVEKYKKSRLNEKEEGEKVSNPKNGKSQRVC